MIVCYILMTLWGVFLMRLSRHKKSKLERRLYWGLGYFNYILYLTEIGLQILVKLGWMTPPAP